MAERESARERILEAACDLIAAEGIDDVRIARVAMRAGASTALVHHYFSTREELLEQALLHSFEQVGDERFADADAEGETATATAALAEAIEECLPRPGRYERDWVLWVELWLRAAREPDLRPLAASLYARYHEWLEDVLKRGIESGEFKAPADLPALTDRAMALLDGLGLRALLHDPTMDIDAARAQVADFLAEPLGIDAKDLARPVTKH
ncbi:MAG TPA: TetR/AcrR family transcriptional regulator [Solirubrobacterales bacterium]|jgi:AcrR family transcriptional regulator|nr:TetR/AcrR family transcriptional regulator [Solirubrobacterales bacterium]